MTRQQLVERITVEEFNDWVALFAVEAIERERAERKARAARRR
jgi:hypothetical protein